MSVVECWLVIEGPPVTKKNSLRIQRNRKTGKPFVAQSSQHNAWADKAVWQLRNQWRRPALTMRVTVNAAVYRQTNVGDLVNYLQAVGDALEAGGVLANDRQIASWDGSQLLLDRKWPRVEIELREAMA